MGRSGTNRWIASGLVAAAVLFLFNFTTNVLILGPQWNDAITALGRLPMAAPHVIQFGLLNVPGGLAVMWIYAVSRPGFRNRFTAALSAGAAAWVLGYAVPYLFILILDVLPAELLWADLIVGAVQVPVATLTGAWFFGE